MANVFRRVFPTENITVHNWFPGHMARAKRSLADLLKTCDVILEVRDARIPLSSANPLLQELAPHKPRLLLFNKTDLADPQREKSIREHYSNHPSKPLLLFSTSNTSKSPAVPQMIQMIKDSQKSRSYNQLIKVMVMGIPNVGKSSFINLARQYASSIGFKVGGKAVIGPNPGVTRAITGFRVSDDPQIFLLDSPGVMIPKFEEKETGLKLALTGAVRDSLTSPDILADYLLFLLNNLSSDRETMARKVGFSAPIDDINVALVEFARSRKLSTQDWNEVARLFISCYRNGEFGRFTLDLLEPQEDRNVNI